MVIHHKTMKGDFTYFFRNALRYKAEEIKTFLKSQIHKHGSVPRVRHSALNDRHKALRPFFIAYLMCFAMTFVVNSQIVLRQADVIILVLK